MMKIDKFISISLILCIIFLMFSGCGKKAVEIKSIELWNNTAEVNYNFGNNENYVDYCEALDNIHSYENVKIENTDKKAIESTGENIRLVADGNESGVIIYKRNNSIAAFTVTVYSRSFAITAIKTYTSEDGKKWNPVNMRMATTDNLYNRYAKVNLISNQTPAPEQKYLKIEFSSAIQIGRVGFYEYTECFSGKDYSCEYERSSNLKSTENGYVLTDNKTAYLDLCRYNIYSGIFRISYTGNLPGVLIRYSTEGTVYENVAAFRTKPIERSDNNFEFYAMTSGQLPEGASNIRLYIFQPDPKGTATITEAKLCAGGYYDDCNTLNEVYEYDDTLKVKKSAEYTAWISAENTSKAIINRNDIKGFQITINKLKNAKEPTISISKDSKTYQPVTFKRCENILNEDTDFETYTIRNSEIFPNDFDYLKLEIPKDCEIDNISTDSIYDPSAELRKICDKKGKKFSDVFSIAHINGGYTHNKVPYMQEGLDAVKKLGGKSINLWISAGLNRTSTSFSGYAWNSDWEIDVKGQVEVMKTKYITEALKDSQMKTMVLSINPSGDMPTICNVDVTSDNKFNSFLKQDYEEIYDFCCYMLENYANCGKRFIISTWESDWWFGNPNDDYKRSTLDRFAEVINNRQKAFDDARAKVPMVGFELYNCLEAVDMVSALNNKDCVTTYVFPKTKCDMYAYSSYDTSIAEVMFGEALELMRKYAPESKMLGRDNLIVGEMGIPENEYAEKFNSNIIKGYKTLINHDYGLGVMWQLFCNEPYNKNLDYLNSHNNEDYRGFWLIRADGTNTPLYNVLKMALK